MGEQQAKPATSPGCMGEQQAKPATSPGCMGEQQAEPATSPGRMGETGPTGKDDLALEKENTVEMLIKTSYAQLSKSERKVADYILLHGYDVAQMSISAFAQQCGTSEPTVMRFAAHIGFDGYTDMKLKIMKDWGKRTSGENTSPLLVDLYINKEDKLGDIPAKMVGLTIRALNDTLGLLSLPSYAKAVKAIGNANKIDIYGVGNSGSIASDMLNKFLRIGLNARAFQDNHIQQISSLGLTGKDAAIAISHSGSTRDVVDTLALAKKAGAVTIAITNYKASKIAEYSDIVLCTGDFETTFYSETMVSRISQLALVDMLYMGVLLSDYERYTAHLNKVNLLVEGKNYK